MLGKKWPDEAAPTLQACSKSMERLKEKLIKLKKRHTCIENDTNLETFLNEMYTLLSIGIYKGRVLHFSPVKQELPRSHPELPLSTRIYKDMQQKMYSLTCNANKKN